MDNGDRREDLKCSKWPRDTTEAMEIGKRIESGRIDPIT